MRYRIAAWLVALARRIDPNTVVTLGQKVPIHYDFGLRAHTGATYHIGPWVEIKELSGGRYQAVAHELPSANVEVYAKAGPR